MTLTQTPNTQSQLDNSDGASRTNSTLSTQIIIKVGNNPVGALQGLTVSQTRNLERIKEVGTDGIIEIVPNQATTYDLRAERVVFDQLRLTEAFSRGFRFIGAQRIPFDIEIMDISFTGENVDISTGPEGIVAMTYKNCWFTNYETPYRADNYVITETASIWAETAFLTGPAAEEDIPNSGGIRGLQASTDGGGVERQVNSGKRLGSLDASGLVNSFFERTEA